MLKEEIPEIEEMTRLFYVKAPILKYSPPGEEPKIFEEEAYFQPDPFFSHVYVYSLLAVFILLIAGVNFVNITTAQAFRRRGISSLSPFPPPFPIDSFTRCAQANEIRG